MQRSIEGTDLFQASLLDWAHAQINEVISTEWRQVDKLFTSNQIISVGLSKYRSHPRFIELSNELFNKVLKTTQVYYGRFLSEASKATIEGVTYQSWVKKYMEGHHSHMILVARTETSRAANNILRTRAEENGSEGYIWRTSRDSTVRPSHKRMEGKYIEWDNPPTLDKLTGHAGTLPNCRCFPEVDILNEYNVHKRKAVAA